MRTIWSSHVLSICTAGLLASVCPAQNLLPNASFELGLNGRDYNGGGLFAVDDTQGYHGTRSLVVSNRWAGTTRRGMTSRMFQAAAGVHTFSFYARAVSTNVVAATNATVMVNLRANPFACNRGLPGVQASARISGSEWRRYTVKGELAPSNGGWYWLTLALDQLPAGGGKVWIDAIMLNAGAEALPFETHQPVEYALQMEGDFTRIYSSIDGLPPIRVVAANGRDEPADRALELKIVDFRQRPVFATNFALRVPGQAVLTRDITVKLDRIGPFRAELYEAGGLIQDELIFSAVPKIEHPVLATQYASPSPTLRHMYKTLGFKYGADVGVTWERFQPKGPNEWDQQALTNMDAVYEGLKSNFDAVYILLHGLPEWANKWPEEKDSPFHQARHKKFPLKPFLDYVEAVVRRYPDWNYYHIMNEPFGWDPADYVVLLEHARQRLDSVRSGIKILAPNSYPRLTGWTERFIAAGGLKYTDILSQHAYTAGGGESLEALSILRKWAAADGNTNRPIWNTETALHPYHIMTWYTMFMPANIGSWADGRPVPDCHPAEQGAERWAKMYLMQTAMGVSRFFSHVAPAGYSELPRFVHMRHAEPDGSRQPVAVAWAVAGNMVGETTGSREIAVSPHLTALSYTRGDTVIIALWMKTGKGPADVYDPLAAGLFRPYAEAAAQHRGRLRVMDPYVEYPFSMPSGAQAFAAFDMFGNPLPIHAVGDRMKLTVSRLPIYLQAKQLTPKACADLLAQSEIEGLVSFKSYVEIGRTSAQEAGLLVDVASAIPKTISVTAAVTRLPPGFETGERTGTTELPPQQKRRIEFPFTRMALPLEGQGEFTVVLNDGKSETVLQQPPAWLAAAVRRPGIVVDGDLADWEGIPPIHLGKPFQVIIRPETWSGPDDSSARLRFAWDETNLYVAAEVVDDQVHDTSRSWHGECVELFLNMRLFENQDDTALGPQTRQYFLNPPVAGAWPTGRVDAVGQVEGGRLAGQRMEKGYRMEAVIPLVNLQSAGFVAQAGGAIGMQPTLCDYDAKEKSGCKLVWTGKPKEYLDTSGWGRLVFLGDSPDRLLRKGDGRTENEATLSAWNFDRADQLDDNGGAGFGGVVANAVCREPGGTNAYLFFDGSNSSVSVRQGRWDVKRKRFEIRFKADPDYRKPTLLWMEHVAPGWRYLGRITPDGQLTVGLYIHQEPTIELVSKTMVRHDGAWIDASYEWDADRGRMALYINGVKEAEREGAVIQPATENLWIGGAPEENAWFRGGIQRVRISALP